MRVLSEIHAQLYTALPLALFFFCKYTCISIFYRIEISEDFTVTLEIRETQTTDAGCYVINIENEFGSDSAQAEVTIDFAAPHFTSALADLRVTLNDNARLECAYDGLPLPDVTWLVSGLSVGAEKVKERIFLKSWNPVSKSWQ